MLTGEAKKVYQRKYMQKRRKRVVAPVRPTVLDPVNVRPNMLDPVRPLVSTMAHFERLRGELTKQRQLSEQGFNK